MAPKKRKPGTTAERHQALAGMGKESYVSQRGIHNLLRLVDLDGIPEAYSRITLWRARKTVCSEKTAYGKLVVPVELPGTDGQPRTIAIQNPLAMFCKSASDSDAFGHIVKEALEKYPCSPASPWKIICYEDGVNPSDGLSKNTSRKSGAFYWSFLQFGMRNLCKEECWFAVCVLREGIVKEVEGGFQAVAAAVLNSFFDPDGHDLERVGVSFYIDGEHYQVFAILGILLADGPALKDLTGCKGHSSIKACPLCMNMTNHKPPGGGVPCHLLSSYAVSMAEPKLAKFKLHTDATLIEMMKMLDEYKVSLAPKDFEEKEKQFGWTWNKHSLLLNHRLQLKVVSCLMFDWAHCYLCDGLADTECALFLKHLHTVKASSGYRELATYVENWTSPYGLPSVARLFTKSVIANNLKNGTFSCTASEFLTLVPSLVLYLTRIVLVRADCLGHVQSMIAVLEVVEILQAVRRGVVSPDVLDEAIQKHLELFRNIYMGMTW